MAKRALHAQNLPEDVSARRPRGEEAKALVLAGDGRRWSVTQLSPNIGKEMVARQLDSPRS